MWVGISLAGKNSGAAGLGSSYTSQDDSVTQWQIMEMSLLKAQAEISSERGHNSGYPLWRDLALVLVWTALLVWTKAKKFQIRGSLKELILFFTFKLFPTSGWDVAGSAKVLNYMESNWSLFSFICVKVCNGKKKYGITASTGSVPIYSDQEFDPSAFSPDEEIWSFHLFTHTSNSGLSFSPPPQPLLLMMKR